MKDLTIYFENPFADPRIALDRKKAFGEDTIQRITVQNTSHQFDTLLAATQQVQNDLVADIASLSTDRAVRQARTKTTDGIMEEFTARNSKLNAFFVATGVNEQPVYEEFFPQGVQAFTKDVTKENVEERMTTLIGAITRNTTIAGGAAVLTQYTAFLTNYQVARAEQLNKTGQISSGMDERDATEAAWDDQMFNNLLTFAQLNRNEPENITLYMNPTLLVPDAHHGTTLTGKLKGMITDSAGHPVKNVIVHILDGKMDNAHSNENGVYLTHPLPIGTWDVEYSKGKSKITKQVEIKEGDELTVDVVL